MRDGTPTRKRLERCALELFVEKGIHATTIKDIAQHADIAEGTLYRHYESKEQLAYHLFSKSYQEIAVQLKECAEKYSSIEQRLSAMIQFFCEQYDKDPVLFNYLLLSQHYQLKNFIEKGQSGHDLLIPFFNEAIRNKEVPKGDPHFYAAVTLGIVLQAAVSRVYERITRSMLEDARALVEAILGAIKFHEHG